jgi:hypothetical protein
MKEWLGMRRRFLSVAAYRVLYTAMLKVASGFIGISDRQYGDALLALSGLAAPVTVGSWFVWVLIVGGLASPATVGAWAAGTLVCIVLAAMAWRRVRREEMMLAGD